MPVNKKGEILCAWTGPLTVALFFIAWVGFAGWIPPPPPAMSAADVAAMYQQHTIGIRIGMMLMMYSGPLYACFSAIIMVYMLQMRGPSPALAYTQFGAGVATVLFLIVPAQISGAVVYRPDRPPDITQFGNDLGWFNFDMVNSTLIVQYLAVGLAILFDDVRRPVFPRWFALVSFWSSVTLIPASLITFFKAGPFSWAGILGFYLGVVVFTLWCLTMFYVLVRAIRASERNVEGSRA